MSYAKLSSALNNCALHGIIPELKDEILKLGADPDYNNKHVREYDRLKNEFAAFYGIDPQKFTWAHFAEVCKLYNALDMQILMGPVLRSFMKETINNALTAFKADVARSDAGLGIDNTVEIKELTEISPLTARYETLAPDQVLTYAAAPLGFGLSAERNKELVLKDDPDSTRDRIATIRLYHQDGGAHGEGVGGHWERTDDKNKLIQDAYGKDPKLAMLLPLMGNGLPATNAGLELLKKHGHIIANLVMTKKVTPSEVDEYMSLYKASHQIESYMMMTLHISKASAQLILEPPLSPITLNFIDKYPTPNITERSNIARYLEGEKKTKLTDEESKFISYLNAPHKSSGCLWIIKETNHIPDDFSLLDVKREFMLLKPDEYIGLVTMIANTGNLKALLDIPVIFRKSFPKLYKKLILEQLEKSDDVFKVFRHEFINEDFDTYIEIMLASIKKNPANFERISPQLFNMKEPKHYKAYQELVAAKEPPTQHIKDIPSATIVKNPSHYLSQLSTAVKNDWTNLQYFRQELALILFSTGTCRKEYAELAISAVQQDIMAFVYVNQQFTTVKTIDALEYYKDIALAAIKHNIDAGKHIKWDYLNFVLKDEKELVESRADAASIRYTLIRELAQHKIPIPIEVLKRDYEHLSKEDFFKSATNPSIRAFIDAQEAAAKKEAALAKWEKDHKKDTATIDLYVQKLKDFTVTIDTTSLESIRDSQTKIMSQLNQVVVEPDLLAAIKAIDMEVSTDILRALKEKQTEVKKLVQEAEAAFVPNPKNEKPLKPDDLDDKTNAALKTSRKKFDEAILLLQKKIDQFQPTPEHKDAYDAALALKSRLNTIGNTFFTNPNPTPDDYKTFKTDCKNEISNAREGVLSHQRGWKKILLNIFAIIITAGIGYAIAAGIYAIATKNKLTFFSTDSVKTLTEIEDTLENDVEKDIVSNNPKLM